MRLAFAAIALAANLLIALPASAQEKLTIVLDWFLNPDHAPLVVAQEKGFFADVGLDVTLVSPADPSDPPKLVAAGKADLAVSYQPQFQMQVGEGLPLVRIGTLISTPLNTVVVLADGPVKTVKDLKGRRIGVSVGGFEDALLGAMLEKAGLTLNDVTLVNVNFSLTPALLSGQVDAVVGAFRNFELNQMAIEKREGRAFYPEEEGIPSYDELILVANKAQAGDPRFPRFLAAVERAVLYILNHPEVAHAAFTKGRPELNDDLNRRAWADTLPRFAHSPAALDAARYARFAAFLKARGLIDTLLPVEAYAITVKQ